MISAENKSDYQKKGYFVLRSAVDARTLNWLQVKCEAALAWKEEQMLARGTHEEGINLLKKRPP